MFTTLFAAAGLLAAFAQPAAANPGAYTVVFLNGVDGCDGDTGLQTQLAAQPGVGKVDAFNASIDTPSVALLDQYDMAVVISDCDGLSDGEALGNNLADYEDHGGVVVEYTFGMQGGGPPFEITGRWMTGGYSPYISGGNQDNNVTLGTHDASSPLMAGVSTLISGGCNTNPSLAPGASRVALWDSGQEAIALKGQAVAVNAGVDDTSCGWSGDYARLTLNAVKLLDKDVVASGTAISKAKINRKKGTAKFLFGAPGTVTGFDCALARKKKGKQLNLVFSPCSSPKRYRHLKRGKYTFEVRATNQFGADPNPAARKFKI
jgi:hypothetical protein